eukprot:TRINITY_DN108599_c0_g1_i1.p1 TRINITY_DN108599_c0_g1~~TRINITY_DN108599_c0_g1_i1.p1  ORF type:complete len:255 (-),score=31.66 TRINITY_DN108599_c0_g1_i1:105-869(-)
MGAILSLVVAPRKRSLVLLGLDNAGKTSLLKKIREALGGEIRSESAAHNRFPNHTSFFKTLVTGHTLSLTKMDALDLGGRCQDRVLQKRLCEKSDGIVFAIDSSDRRRLEEAIYELENVLAEESLIHIPLLVLANKQDLASSISSSELGDMFSRPDRAYRVQGCSARTGQGLEDGFNWLFSTLGSQSALQSFHDPLSDPLQKFSKLRPESVAETESTADVESHMADIELSDGRTDNHGASHLGKHSKNQTISIA